MHIAGFTCKWVPQSTEDFLQNTHASASLSDMIEVHVQLCSTQKNWKWDFEKIWLPAILSLVLYY